VTALLVQLEGQDGHPEIREGASLLRWPGLQRHQPVHATAPREPEADARHLMTNATPASSLGRFNRRSALLRRRWSTNPIAMPAACSQAPTHAIGRSRLLLGPTTTYPGR